jgi:hypothetical protein
MAMEQINCLKCKHFFITFDELHPRGCRVFDLKTPNMPWVDVKKITGIICPAFEKSKIITKKERFTGSNFDTTA